MNDKDDPIAFEAPWVKLDPADDLVIKEIEGERDRGAALIAGAWVDERLSQTIKLLLRPATADANKSHNALFKPPGGLTSNFSRIHLGYLLQLYPIAVLDLLVTVSEIRNKFAHKTEPISFSSPGVIEKCANLKNSLLNSFWTGGLFLIEANKQVRNPRERSFQLPENRFRITDASTERETYIQTCKTLLFLLAWARDVYANEFFLVQPEGPLPDILAEQRKKKTAPQKKTSQKKPSPD
jgi:hypothetical protein